MQAPSTAEFHETVLRAGEEHALAPLKNSPLRFRLLLSERELLERFAARYAELLTLSRQMRRALQRKWKRSLAGIALLLAIGYGPAIAATINVGPGCTLANAIRSANTNTSIGGCTAGSEAPDAIFLPTNSTQTLSLVNNTTFGPTGLPVITSAITIFGNNSRIVRNSAAGTPEFRILAVQGGPLTLRNTILSGGKTPNADAPTYAESEHGGGIFSVDSDVTLINCTITGNSATLGGGLHHTDTNPQDSSYGVLEITNSTISGNAARDGGALRTNTVVKIRDSAILRNSARIGGAFATGGFDIYSGITITNSTISGNSAVEKGGGGIGDIGLNNTTVTANSARIGGGMYAASKSVIALKQSVISGNHAEVGAEVYRFTGTPYDTPGIVLNYYSNIFGHSGNAGVSGFTPGPADIVPAEELASIIETTLSSNGGTTQSHHLPKGSPAVDAVPLSDCPPPETDQRGVKRPIDEDSDQVAECDIGAVERLPNPPEPEPEPPPEPTPEPEPPPVSTPEPQTCNGIAPTFGCTVNGVANQLCLGTSGDDIIIGTSGIDVIVGFSGNDTLSGGAGPDLICGGSGNDTLLGNAGADRLFGGDNDDSLKGGRGADVLNGDPGNDSCAGGPGSHDGAANCETVSNVP
jgi:Ca2+-binding RTX toxin-like protein